MWDNYTWNVSPAPGCVPYASYNRTDFCRLLQGRDVLLIGDSISQLSRTALWNMAASRVSQHQRWTYGRAASVNRFPYQKPIEDLIDICEDNQRARVTVLLNWAIGDLRLSNDLPFRTISERCDSLGCKSSNLNVTRGSPDDRIWGVDEFVRDYVLEKGLHPGLIVVNSGAHMQADDVFLPQVRAALAVITASHPSATVVWRNTPPGHANCSLIRAPLLEPQHGPLPYDWHELVRQNDLVASLIEREFPGVVYMDVATSTALRGDFHVSAMLHNPPTNADCMHYIEPGPMDHWIRTLYNVLLAQGKKE